MPKAKIVGVKITQMDFTDSNTGALVNLNNRTVHLMFKSPDVDGYAAGSLTIQSKHPKQADLDGIFEYGNVITVERNAKGKLQYQPGEETEPDFVI